MGHQPGEIPPFLSYTSPVSNSAPPELRYSLPLNLIAHIISYLDDISDIARVTRTCRLMYYMCQPNLYKTVSLHSYPEVRYRNGRPEGFGSGSPFMMALNGMITKNHAALINELRIWGEWKEIEAEEFAKGRVPDNTMMLNILLRAATDRMGKLQTFIWDLEKCKPLRTLYEGLSTHTTLTTLTLRFSSSREPRPTVIIPPIPNLRAFKVLNIDPMCYPDDISMLLLGSTKLEDLRLHFSPRMRREAESSLSMDAYFGRCTRMKYVLKIRHFGLENFYGPNPVQNNMELLFDGTTCQSVCFLNTFGSVGGDPRTVFVDDTWKNLDLAKMHNARVVRTNDVTTQHFDIMLKARNLVECFYMVGTHSNSQPDKSASPLTSSAGAITTPAHSPDIHDSDLAALKDRYIHAITRVHGSSIRHLLLSDRFALSIQDVRDIIRHCPNLEQLGFAMDTADHDTVRLLAPFVPNLKVLRLLRNEFLDEHMRNRSHAERIRLLGEDLGHSPASKLRYLGLGDTIYETGELRQIETPDAGMIWRRDVKIVGPEAVKDVELFKLDVVDLNADPIAPFL